MFYTLIPLVNTLCLYLSSYTLVYTLNVIINTLCLYLYILCLLSLFYWSSAVIGCRFVADCYWLSAVVLCCNRHFHSVHVCGIHHCRSMRMCRNHLNKERPSSERNSQPIFGLSLTPGQPNSGIPHKIVNLFRTRHIVLFSRAARTTNTMFSRATIAAATIQIWFRWGKVGAKV